MLFPSAFEDVEPVFSQSTYNLALFPHKKVHSSFFEIMEKENSRNRSISHLAPLAPSALLLFRYIFSNSQVDPVP